MPYIRNVQQIKPVSNLLNDVSLFGFTILLKNGQKKKENDTFLKKKAEEKENSATTMISVDRKGTVFPVKLKLQGESFEKTLIKRILKKV